MINLDKLACKITGRRFRFHATLKYTPDSDNGNTNVTKVVEFSCDTRNPKTMSREVKKLYGGDMISKLPKYLLKNGHLEISQISYLGFY